MSKLAEYKALEAQIEEQRKRLEALKNDTSLKQEIEFETKLRSLLGEYGMSLRDVINLLDPESSSKRQSAAPAAKTTRRERAVKRYKNPHNGEIVETKGGNHKTLKAWKQEFGASEVESWLE